MRLVDALRNTKEWVGFPAVPICLEAADEIERLRAALKRIAGSNIEQRVGDLDVVKIASEALKD